MRSHECIKCKNGILKEGRCIACDLATSSEDCITKTSDCLVKKGKHCYQCSHERPFIELKDYGQTWIDMTMTLEYPKSCGVELSKKYETEKCRVAITVGEDICCE